MTRVRNDNLTYAEARERSALLSIDSYDVHVDLTHAGDPEIEAFPVRATVRFEVVAEDPARAETFIEYIHHSIDSVVLNGEQVDRSRAVEGSRIALRGLKESNELTVHGYSWFSRSGEGMHRLIDPEDGRVYLYTQYEPADCRRVFPAFEQPDLKATFRFSVTAPKEWVVASNAPIASEQEDPSNDAYSKRLFAPTQRISTYITTLLAGNYHAVGSLYRPTDPALEAKPITLYCRQAMAEHLPADELFEVVGKGLDFFQELFDYPYPFPKYDQAFVPEYNLGAMENPGLVTLSENYLFPGGATVAQREGRANTIMHEMSHMWFGDLVTMPWWSDLWLKESFAEFMGSLGAERAIGYDQAWVSFAHGRKAWAYRQDSFSTTHPIVADIPDIEAARQNFDGITYAKGAAVLKQLVAHVGFERFIAATRTYFRRHAYGTAALEDFLAVLAESCGRDLSAWSAQWLQTSGISELSIRGARLHQTLPASVPAAMGRSHTLRVAGFSPRDGELVRVADSDVEVPSGAEGLDLALPSEIEPFASAEHLVVVNHADLTYALTDIAEEQLATALRHGHTLSDPLDRALLDGSLWNMVREARLPPEDYVDFVARGLAGEQSASILTTSVAQAYTAILEYTPPRDRAPLWTSVSEALDPALRGAKDGSDQRLILLRFALKTARHTTSMLPYAREVVESFEASPADAVWHGLRVDDTLAWNARIAMALHGELGLEELNGALERWRNHSAAIGHAQAVASLVDVSIKSDSLDAIDRGELSNDLLSATIAGYMSGPAWTRRGYEQRYFDSLVDLWDRKSMGMATRIVRGLFPDLDSDPAAVEHGRAWLREHDDAPAALRRLLVEATEEAERAQRIRTGTSSPSPERGEDAPSTRPDAKCAEKR